MRDQDGGKVCHFKYSSQEGLIDNIVFEPKLRGEETNKPQGYLGKKKLPSRGNSWCRGPGASICLASLWILETGVAGAE